MREWWILIIVQVETTSSISRWVANSYQEAETYLIAVQEVSVVDKWEIVHVYETR